MTEPITQALTELLNRLSDRLPEDRFEIVEDWIHHREWSLAADSLAYTLRTNAIELDPTEREQFRWIIQAMDLPLSHYSYLNLDQGT